MILRDRFELIDEGYTHSFTNFQIMLGNLLNATIHYKAYSLWN